jgi:hypothetical protein
LSRSCGTEHGVSERFACRVLGQHRSTQRKLPKPRDDEAALTADIIALAIQYGRYGYRRIPMPVNVTAITIRFQTVLSIPHKLRHSICLSECQCDRLPNA